MQQRLPKEFSASTVEGERILKKLVIIGANDFQNQLILKAKALGYETHVFAWRDGAVGEKTADYFYPISIVEKDEILDKCREIQPDGVCSIASDLAAITVNYVAEGLGLPCNQTEHTAIQTNKYAMRRALMDGGISCPKFALAQEDADFRCLLQGFRFPVIVKPTDRSGSRSIMKLESFDGMEEAVQAACAASFEKKAIIEEYITGREYSIETISYQGKHHFLAVTQKFTTGAPHFIETGHRQPSDLPEETVLRAKAEMFRALDALHVENSAGHGEFRVDENGNIRFIEIGARMGGDCIGSDLVYLSTGHDFMKMVIDVACGCAPALNECPTCRNAEIRFLFNEEDVAQFHKWHETHASKIYRVSDFDMTNCGNVTDSSTRIGYYIICDSSV